MGMPKLAGGRVKATGENGDEYVERDVLRTLIVAKRVIFNSTEECVGNEMLF
jgi:hypothetical protein